MVVTDYAFKDFMATIGASQEVYAFEDFAKDEVVPQDRKSGSGNGTIHFYIQGADHLFEDEFPALYEKSCGNEHIATYPKVSHYFDVSNLISTAAYAYSKIKKEDLVDGFKISDYLSLIDENLMIPDVTCSAATIII